MLEQAKNTKNIDKDTKHLHSTQEYPNLDLNCPVKHLGTGKKHQKIDESGEKLWICCTYIGEHGLHLLITPDRDPVPILILICQRKAPGHQGKENIDNFNRQGFHLGFWQQIKVKNRQKEKPSAQSTLK